ncbi:hypothetical protein X801_02332 [Opisthorchis viverrini]|uniref:PAT complex subunit CCDC47 n=1 Tax=Opisthorchis viverrini TaxID=6198 RepID=A0A1S8X522_OPIVI|nr:hypothetical protein X801_02332 [Opisthorchis viverrini]
MYLPFAAVDQTDGRLTQNFLFAASKSRNMLKSFVKSQLDIPIHFIWLLLTGLFFQFPGVDGLASLTEDEFAEFTDPDDTFTSDITADISSAVPKSSIPKSPPDQETDGNRSQEDSEVTGQPLDASVSSEVDDGMLLVNRKPVPLTEADRMKSDTDATVESDEFEDVVIKDDDEFEDIPSPSDPVDRPTAQSKEAHSDLKVVKIPRHLRGSWDSYYLEMLFISMLVIYFSNFLIGRSKNTQLATAWFAAHKPILETQFAMVGDDGQAEPGSGTLLKESEHLYSLWCSGRAYCDAMLVELRLLKRQCLVFTLANWFQPAYDTIVAKVIMEDSEMDGWVMAVGRKRRLQALMKDHQDLAFFCPDKRGQRHPGLPESLTVLSELSEATTSMLNAPICKFLTDNEECVDYLFFSDQYTGPKPPPDETPSAKLPVTQKVLIFGFRVGTKGSVSVEDMEAAAPLFQFIFYVIDKVHRLRLGKEAKAKSERNRQRAYDTRLKAVHSLRQEAAQTRREERVRANKERIMAEEDPEKARRLESQSLPAVAAALDRVLPEREQRKEKAKKMPKMKMLKTRGM